MVHGSYRSRGAIATKRGEYGSADRGPESGAEDTLYRLIKRILLMLNCDRSMEKSARNVKAGRTVQVRGRCIPALPPAEGRRHWALPAHWMGIVKRAAGDAGAPSRLTRPRELAQPRSWRLRGLACAAEGW